MRIVANATDSNEEGGVLLGFHPLDDRAIERRCFLLREHRAAGCNRVERDVNRA